MVLGKHWRGGTDLCVRREGTCGQLVPYYYFVLFGRQEIELPLKMICCQSKKQKPFCLFSKVGDQSVHIL